MPTLREELVYGTKRTLTIAFLLMLGVGFTLFRPMVGVIEIESLWLWAVTTFVSVTATFLAGGLVMSEGVRSGRRKFTRKFTRSDGLVQGPPEVLRSEQLHQ